MYIFILLNNKNACMGQIQSHRGILQILCVYNSDKGVMHNEVERL